MEIVEAFYGIGQENDVDIRHLFSNEMKLSKSTDLHRITGKDPYPNQTKFVQVTFTSQVTSSKILREECLKIKEGGHRVGFEGTAFQLEIPNMYSFKVLDASFSIHGIDVLSNAKTSSSTNVKIPIPPDRWKYVVNRSTNGFYDVQENVKMDDLTSNGDPFPGEPKKFIVYYSQSARYQVNVYEIGGYLVKDVVLVELPRYPCTMLYHLYPKFQHPVMTIHKRYLQKCANVFQKIVVSIAHDRLGARTDEDAFLRIVGQNTNAKIYFLHTLNSRQRGEAMSFMNLLNTVTSFEHDHLVFYAHSKGLGHHNRNYVESISRWVELMYVQCLMNMDTMIYKKSNFGGSFRKNCLINGHSNPRWHYSGSFYLLNSSVLHRRQMISRYSYDYYISERFPGLCCPNGEKCLVFLEVYPPHDDLYNRKSSQHFEAYIPSLS